MTMDIIQEVDLELLTKIAKELNLPNRVELAQYVFENPNKKFKSVDDFVICFKKDILMKEIMRSLNKVQEDFKVLKADIAKRQLFIVEFEDGSRETLFSDNPRLEIETDIKVLRKLGLNVT